MPRQRSRAVRQDFDGAWKEVLQVFLPQCLALLEPRMYAMIDWERGVVFLDKELRSIGARAAKGGGTVDCLVKVWLLDGGETWLLVHVEVQNQVDRTFEARMFLYFARLVDKHKVPVASLAILGDADANWRPYGWSASALLTEAVYRFPVVKLLDWRERTAELEASNNPFAGVLVAHLEALATAGNVAERAARKLARLKWLYSRGHERETVVTVLRFLDWLLQVPEREDERIWAEIEALEAEGEMPYVMSIERIAERRGRQEGRRHGLKVMLKLVHGEAGQRLGQRLATVTDEAVFARLEAHLRAKATLATLEAEIDATVQAGA